jgi:O-antigen/teichoic acid export membrane protein
VYAFFIWQAGVSLFQTVVFAGVLWKNMPISGARPLFKKEILMHIWRFAAGMTGISVFAVMLMQMDKIVLSKLLTLEMFGYYSLASLVGYGVYVIVSPFFAAIFPRFSYLVSKGDEKALVSLYHRSCQVLSSLILPMVFVVAVFSKEILIAWTHSPLIAEKTYRLASVLIIGTGLNGLMNIPYALQLAYGWTRLGVYANIVGVILLVPLVYMMAKWHGAIGAAFVWVILNTGYIVIVIPIMHAKILKNEKSTWYIRDVGLPLVGALGVALLGKWLFFSPNIIETVIYIFAIFGISILAAALTTPYFRNMMKVFLLRGIGYVR